MAIQKYDELVEEIKKLPREDKEDLKFLIERYLIEERRREIYENYKKALEEEKAGKLIFTSDFAELKKSLEE